MEKYNYLTELEINNEAFSLGVDFTNKERFNKFLKDWGYIEIYIHELMQNIYIYKYGSNGNE